MEKQTKQVPVQHKRQVRKTKFVNHNDAMQHREALGNEELTRIRLRADGTFDVVEYEKLQDNGEDS